MIVALAGWRLAHLLVEEDGPFSMFDRLRAGAGVGKEGEVGFFAGLLSCVWCASFWTVLFSLALYQVLPVAALALAAWGLACALQAWARQIATDPH